MDIEKIRAARQANPIHYFESIGSTMTEAASLAETGAPHGTVVLAEEQWPVSDAWAAPGFPLPAPEFTVPSFCA